MRLADFIERERESILREWETFAATMLPAAANMIAVELRDHAQQILEAVTQDLRRAQTAHEQAQKALGLADAGAEPETTAAQTHAVLRAASGFDINQLVAEYRAMRSCVLRLWIKAAPPEYTAFEDMLRFNEAIDQAVAESVKDFNTEVENARSLLLGVLGHDMRSPLSTIIATASYLQSLDAGASVSAAAGRLTRSGASLKALLDDLVDFSRTQLGLGLVVHPAMTDLETVAADEIEQLRGAHPDRLLELSAHGDTRGNWDANRLHQVLRNLIANALLYGDPQSAVHIALRGEDSEIHLSVTNNGSTIDTDKLTSVFAPLSRATERGDGLGLGLFIVRAITEQHGGSVDVSSVDGLTSFRVRLPR